MTEEKQDIDYHLGQALSHIRMAIDQSITSVQENQQLQKEIGKKWEVFIGEFFDYIREKGKQYRINLLTWIRFPKLRH